MRPRIVVVGAGISGLTVAYRLHSLGAKVDVEVHEASDQVGGLIRTEQSNGFLIEHGPESILRAKPAAHRLAIELGLEEEILETRQHVGGAFILQQGRLLRIPEGFSLMAPARINPFLASPLFSWSAKLRVLAEPLVKRRDLDADESLASFVRRRLGNEVLERVAQPMISGIYGADPEALSLAASMPRFVELEREHGSLLRGLARKSEQSEGASGARYKLFFSFRRGMQTLTDALARQIRLNIQTSSPVTAIRTTGSRWRIETGDTHREADAVILAVPAPIAASLLATSAGSVKKQLQTIPYGRGAAVALAYDRRTIAHPLDAYGFVVPRVENTDVIACTFMHQKWAGRAPAGKALLRAFVVDQTDRSDKVLVASVHDELCRWLEISSAPLQFWVSRHLPSTPHYTLGHQARVTRLFEETKRTPGLHLVGNAYRGVGIPDSIALADQTARSIADQFG